MESELPSSNEDEQKSTKSEAVKPEVSQLTLGAQAQFYLAKSSKWSFILGILGFVFIGVILFSLLFSLSAFTEFGLGTFTWAFTLLYIPLLMLYFFPIYYIFKFGQIGRSAFQSQDGSKAKEALKYLYKFFNFVGYITIIILVLYGLFILSMLVFGVGMNFM